jgi:phage terminase small subunit
VPVLKNPRHERFAQLVASGVRPGEAYVALGYSKNGAAQSAARLIQRTDIRKRLDDILASAAQSVAAEVAFDQKRVLSRLDVLGRKAEELKQFSAAVRCEELIGKERGMFVERSEQVKKIRSVRDMDLEEIEALITEAEQHAKLKDAHEVASRSSLQERVS